MGALLIDNPKHRAVAITEFSTTETWSAQFPMVRHAAEIGYADGVCLGIDVLAI